jgi:hypothetical protein
LIKLIDPLLPSYRVRLGGNRQKEEEEEEENGVRAVGEHLLTSRPPRSYSDFDIKSQIKTEKHTILYLIVPEYIFFYNY